MELCIRENIRLQTGVRVIFERGELTRFLKKKKGREKFRYDFLVYLSKSVVSNGESGEKVTS